jgi:hypothetical protein
VTDDSDLWSDEISAFVNRAFKSGIVSRNPSDAEEHIVYRYAIKLAIDETRQPQTDARVADLLFKLDVAATTFEKVTTSEHREAVFNAEHAKLLRDTIKVLRQPQTDALKMAREAIRGLLDIAPKENLDSEQAGRAYAALHEIGTALAALEQSK